MFEKYYSTFIKKISNKMDYWKEFKQKENRGLSKLNIKNRYRTQAKKTQLNIKNFKLLK